MNEVTKPNTNKIAMTTVEIAQRTGKEHRHVKRDAERMLLELHGKDVPIFGHIYKDSYGREQNCYLLPKREVIILVSGYSIPLRAKIVDMLEELESELMKNQVAIPDFTNPSEAARAWADIYDQKQLAFAQRDEAIRTKAHINNKKTATAMATASVLSRQNKKLKEKLGDGEKYKTVKAIPWLRKYFDLRIKPKPAYQQIGKKLTNLSNFLGFEIRKIKTDSEWDTVNAYHVDVINQFEQNLKEDKNLLCKYRKALP